MWPMAPEWRQRHDPRASVPRPAPDQHRPHPDQVVSTLAPKAQPSIPGIRRASPWRGRAQTLVPVAALAALLAAFSGPPAGAQSGGASGPDPWPVTPAPEPDAAPAPAPDSDSTSVESTPPASRPPAATTPYPTATAPAPSTSTGPASPSSRPAPEPRSSPPASRVARRAERGKRKAARKARTAHEANRRASVTPPRPSPVFRVGLPVSRLAGGDADTDSPPGQLIVFALLTLVLAGASLLTLTARLSREWRV